jgi:hypothetical protein
LYSSSPHQDLGGYTNDGPFYATVKTEIKREEGNYQRHPFGKILKRKPKHHPNCQYIPLIELLPIEHRADITPRDNGDIETYAFGTHIENKSNI